MSKMVTSLWSVCFLMSCLTPVDKVGEGDDPGECEDGIDNDGDGYLDDQDAGCPDVEEQITPNVVVTWDVAGIRLELSSGQSNSNYSFGIAENTGACLDDGSCWTGEDCFQGYETADGDILLYCHPLYGGNSLALEYGSLPELVNEGESTVFADASFQSVVTYILNDLRSSEEGSCWVWGADPSYYEDFAPICSEM